MKYLATTLAALALTATGAFADVTIAAGQEGGGYDAFAKKLETRLDATIPTIVQNYGGSDAISVAVCDEKAQVGIVQKDAMYARYLEGCQPSVIGTYGEEYAYLMVPEGSKISELHDMNAATRVLVDVQGSGSELFWNTIRGIETGPNGNKSTWAKAQTVTDFVFLADTKAQANEVDAVILVRKPDSKDLQELVRAGWKLASIDDKDIDDTLFNGKPLYTRKKAEIAGTGGWFSGNKKANSYVVPSFVIASPETAKNQTVFVPIARAVHSETVGK